MSARADDLKLIDELNRLLNKSTMTLQALPEAYILDLKSRLNVYNSNDSLLLLHLRSLPTAAQETFLNYILRSPENSPSERETWAIKLLPEPERKAREEADRKLKQEQEAKEREEKARNEAVIQRNLQLQREAQARAEAEAKIQAEQEARVKAEQAAAADRQRRIALAGACGF